VSWGEKLKVEGQKSKVRCEVSGLDMGGRVLGERKGSLIIGLLRGEVFKWGKFCSAIAFYGSGSYNYCTAVEITCITQISNRFLKYKGC